MKIVVLGSTGMAGHVVAQYLQEQGHHVYRASRSEKNTDMSAAIDVTDFEALNNWLDSVSPEVIVNCIGLLQKACDARPDQAILLNAYFPHWLEHKYADSPTRIIHLSTDCVFSGIRGNYLENEHKDGVSMYDRSKALGELNNEKDLTFRMSIIGPDIDPKGTGLFNWFMSQSGTIQGWSKAIWNGVTTIELARGISAAVQCKLRGVYQLVPKESIDKCTLLELCKDCFNRKNLIINRIDGLSLNKTLVCSRNDFAFNVRPYDQQIADMAAWVEAHRGVYPHYEK